MGNMGSPMAGPQVSGRIYSATIFKPWPTSGRHTTRHASSGPAVDQRCQPDARSGPDPSAVWDVVQFFVVTTSELI